MIKPSLLIFGLFFLFRRDLRGTVAFSAVCGAFVILSLMAFGMSDNLFWFQKAIVQYSNNWLGHSASNQFRHLF